MFSDVLNTGLVTSVNVDTNQTDKLLRLLDTVVIKLEGGSDEDLKVLDEKPNIEQRPEPVKEPASALAANAAAVANATNAAAKISALNAAAADTAAKSDDGAINENDDDSNDVKEVEPTPVEENANDKPANADEKPSKKRKRTTSGSSSSSSSSTSSSGNSNCGQ